MIMGLLALVAVSAVATTSAAGPEATASLKAPPKLSIVNAKQSFILRNGLKVRVTVQVRKLRRGQRLSRRARNNPIRIKLRGTSNTFDQPGFRQLTRDKVAKFARGNRRGVVKKVVTLRLTDRGRKAIQSCAARTLQVNARGKRTRKQLVRTGRCAADPVDTSRAAECNYIGQQQNSLCLLPFPDNYYTVGALTNTGRRINFQPGAMPRNVSNLPFNQADYNRSDGFSQGNVILVRVPGLDNPTALANTDAAPVNRIGRYEEPDQPVVVIDATTGDRWPIWTEIDSNAGTPEDTLVEIHPARNFIGGHRYIVAMRDLRNSSNAVIEAPPGFRYFRDDLPSKNAAINSQRSRFKRIFDELRESDIKRSNLYLAWDFTVASDMNNAARMLHIRNDAFADLGDTDLDDGIQTGGTVPFNVTQQLDFLPCGAGDPGACEAGEDDQIIRRLRGTFTVPCYLTNACEAPARFQLDGNGMPTQMGTYDANFDCIIPRDSVGGASAQAGSRPSVYGHGLLGSANEVGSSSQKTIAVVHDFVLCATDQIGFASEDVPNTIGILNNLARFPELTDRVQQALLNELLLARLMTRPTGFVTDARFHVDANDINSASTIDPSNVYYQGISQGGILGGAFTAISPDVTRSYLGVPAMNYSVLLPRSIDFDEYELVLNPSYPDPMVRPLLLSLIQMLWDRSEPNGYANRMTDNPLPDTPPHEVLLIPAFGDHQVTTWQVDVEARTVGASVHEPVVVPASRWPNVDVAWGIPRIGSYPFADSALVYFDGGPVRPDPGDTPPVDGTDPPPFENIPNTSGDDPHGLPRREPEERQMVSDFLQPNNLSHIDDECGGACFAGGWTFP